MPRPQKHTVDYFSHDSNASGRKTLTILYNHFGHEGVSAWWQLLERLASTPGHFIEIKNSECLEYLAAKLRFSPDKMVTILSKMAELDAIDRELHQAGIIWSQELVDRLATVYKARGQSLPPKPFIDNPVSVTDNPVNAPDNTPKETKEKETKEDTANAGAGAPLNPWDCCHTFSDYRNLLDATESKVGFLVSAFKRLHHDAPQEDFDNCGGRIAAIWKENRRDTGYILGVMWDSAGKSIRGSHLSFIQGALKKGNGSKPTRDPDGYVKGKYGGLVVR